MEKTEGKFIPRNKVESSQLASVGHDGETTLHVEYRSGGVYEYSGIGREDYDNLIKAESIGKAFHTLKKALDLNGARIEPLWSEGS